MLQIPVNEGSLLASEEIIQSDLDQQSLGGYEEETQEEEETRVTAGQDHAALFLRDFSLVDE